MVTLVPVPPFTRTRDARAHIRVNASYRNIVTIVTSYPSKIGNIRNINRITA